MRVEQRLWNLADSDTEYYQKFIEVIKNNPGSCDAVWALIPPGSIKMEDHLKFIGAFKPVMEMLKAAGVGVSLQCSCLFSDGSARYGKDLYRDVFFGDQTMTLYCWRNQRAREYFTAVLELYAQELKPEAIWFEDDMGVRIYNQFPRCLCASCLEKFNARHGYHYTKDALKIAIAKDIDLRNEFIEFSYEGLAEYAYLLAKAVYKGNPETAAGQMHGDYYGDSTLRVFAAYKRAGITKIMSRCGAGAYNDREPKNLPAKARQIDWQLARLPGYVTHKCPEVENYPHVWYSKSAYGTCLESTLHLAQGFDFLSYSAVPHRQDGMHMTEALFSELSRHKNYWDKLEKSNMGTTRAGARIFVPKNYWNTLRDDWYNVNPDGFAGYASAGLPVTYQEHAGQVIILNGKFADCLSRDEVEFLSKMPVITDGKTLEVLNKKGYGSLIGANAAPYAEDNPVFEGIPGVLFTGHAVNAEISVSGFMGMFGGTENTYRILENDSVEPLTLYGTFGIFGCSDVKALEGIVGDAVCNTPAGGKWAVFGYAPWTEDMSFERRKQLFAAYAYIGGEIPAYINEPNRMELYPRRDKDGLIKNVTVLNASIEKTGTLELTINKPAGDAFLYMDAGRTVELIAKADGTGRVCVDLPAMDGWSAGTVFVS